MQIIFSSSVCIRATAIEASGPTGKESGGEKKNEEVDTHRLARRVRRGVLLGGGGRFPWPQQGPRPQGRSRIRMRHVDPLWGSQVPEACRRNPGNENQKKRGVKHPRPGTPLALTKSACNTKPARGLKGDSGQQGGTIKIMQHQREPCRQGPEGVGPPNQGRSEEGNRKGGGCGRENPGRKGFFRPEEGGVRLDRDLWRGKKEEGRGFVGVVTWSFTKTARSLKVAAGRVVRGPRLEKVTF